MQMSWASLMLLSFGLTFVQNEASADATRMMSEAKLVYGDEIVRYSSGLPVDTPPWGKHFPRNIDALAAGSDIVFGLRRPDCRGYQPGSYAPSDCGDEEIVVLAVPELPAVGGEAMTLGSGQLRGAMFVGTRHGPGRSGCIGFPTRAEIRLLAENGVHMKLSIDIRFELVSHFQYPESCGARAISGVFDFNKISTDDVAVGALRSLFE